MLNWNRKEYSEQTMASILKKTTVEHELIMVDNNSKQEGLKDFLLSVKGNEHTKKVIHVFNEKNLGVAGGRNSGLVKASGDYLITIDDDVLVPDGWCELMIDACDKIPKIGITGVNVEPFKFPLKEINGVRVRPKNGNLGGACLCLPRRVFERVGYYNYFSTYGHEDSMMYYRLKHLGLISAYIEPKGIHLDKDKDKNYRAAKNSAHKKGSFALQALAKARLILEKTGDVYVSFNPNYNPGDINIFTNELILSERQS
jgi:GT2 family glycosyltransferase